MKLIKGRKGKWEDFIEFKYRLSGRCYMCIISYSNVSMEYCIYKTTQEDLHKTINGMKPFLYEGYEPLIAEALYSKSLAKHTIDDYNAIGRDRYFNTIAKEQNLPYFEKLHISLCNK